MIKRILCVLLLLPAFLFCAQAVPKIDGFVKLPEYGQKAATVIATNRESNNEVSAAYLCQCISLEDYSVYIGVRYVCEDVGLMLYPPQESETGETEDRTRQTTGITLWFNGAKCCTAYFDGTVDVADRMLYDADAAFRLYDDTATDNPETNNFDGEVRLGVKQGIPYNAEIGIQILDCSGSPSNLYTFTVNPGPTSTESSTAKETTRKTAESKSETKTTTKSTTKPTTETTTKPTAARRSTTSTESTHAGTAAGIANTALTLESKPQTAPAAVSETEQKKTGRQTKKTGRETTAVAKTAAKSTIAERVPEASATLTEPDTTAAETPATTARPKSDDRSAAADVLQTSKRVSAFHSAKTVGAILTAVLLTAAVMTGAFIGVQKRGDPAEPAPEEETEREPDDF